MVVVEEVVDEWSHLLELHASRSARDLVRLPISRRTNRRC